MPRSVLSEFLLDVDIDSFHNLFWSSSGWFERFLCEKLEDLSVNIGEWQVDEKTGNTVRSIRSYHPANFSFPGLPSHAESHKVQTISIVKTDRDTTMTIKETNTFRGIPYADYFNVNTEWIVKSQNANECSVSIFLDLVFHKSTWLQGTIESNTRAELITVYKKWLESAQDTLKRTKLSISRSRENLENIPSHENIIPSTESMNNKAQSQSPDENKSMATLIRFVSGSSLRADNNHNASDTDDLYGSDEELLFYDCEEGVLTKGGSMNNSSFYRNAPTPQILKDYYSPNDQSVYNPVHMTSSSTGPVLDSQTSPRDIAISIVDTIFVLAQFSYWKVHNFYNYDMKEMFEINPMEVLLRIVNSFFPGSHGSVLLKPDLYGPLIAVFLMPQCVLLLMDVSHHGCSQSAVLGNAVVVSLCLWGGLSSLYRLLSFVIAPTIAMKHCLSMTGYSFFAWNLALISTYPLERYQKLFGLPIALPIVLFGIPSALAQGYMFWEQTPASSMKLQPRSLPSSLQNFAQNNSRWLQKVLWAVPKIIALVIVTGTHYQFLWYVARVFLPGRKQQCELSALVQPSQYADIITQKELRKFALLLINGNSHDD